MESIFIDKKHQIEFERDGYLKFENAYLDDNDINELKIFFKNSGIMQSNPIGFNVSLEHANKILVKQMMEKIHSIVLPKINKLFKNYQAFIATYLGKESNKQGIVLPHQDWTFVEDESINYSFSCWIPLVDVNLQNGCMGFIKGTQNIFKGIRASPASKIVSPLSTHLFSLLPFLNLIEMKAGELLIFNNKVFHASLPNLMNEYRDAIAIVFTHKDLKLRHYYLKPGTKDILFKYSVDTSFFSKYDDKILLKMYENNEIIKDYLLLDEVDFIPENISYQNLESKIISMGNKYDEDLFNYFNKLYYNKNKSLKDKIMNIFIKK